jgi:drug/metabolite transporter (DMT)-like permease
MSRHSLGSLIIAACALSWGTIGIVVRELDMPAMAIVFFRVLLSASAVAAVLLLAGRRDLLRFPGRAVAALGVLLALHWSLYFASIQETSVASAVLITYAGPIFMALIAPALIREHVPAVSIVALAVSAVGIALISLSGGDGGEAVRPLGVALALGAALSMALLIVLLKKYAAGSHPATVALHLDLSAAVVLLPAALAGDYELGTSDALYLLLLGSVLTGAVGVAYVAALRWVAATTAGILAYMEPVSAAVLAALLLGESLTVAIALGGALIVAAGAAVVLRAPEPIAVSAEQPAAPVQQPATST